MRHRDSGQHATPRVPAVAVLIASIVLLLGFLGCSSPTRYRVLNFFFDGVPDPNGPAQTAGGSAIRRGNQGQTFYIHKPLIDGACSQCHKNESGGPPMSDASVPKTVCRECHAKVNDGIAILHGPVASENCTVCHSPHRATEPHLLKFGGRNLCLQCHMLFDLSTKAPEHADPKIDCMSCHLAHGGATRAFLRPSTQPATRPATQPAQHTALSETAGPAWR